MSNGILRARQEQMRLMAEELMKRSFYEIYEETKWGPSVLPRSNPRPSSTQLTKPASIVSRE